MKKEGLSVAIHLSSLMRSESSRNIDNNLRTTLSSSSHLSDFILSTLRDARQSHIAFGFSTPAVPGNAAPSMLSL